MLPGSVQIPGDIAVYKMGKVSAFMELTFLWGDRSIKKCRRKMSDSGKFHDEDKIGYVKEVTGHWSGKYFLTT